jgi:hypothetical protein
MSQLDVSFEANRFSQIRLSDLARLLGLVGRTASPWAVVLCKFADDSSEVAPRSHYERLFTGTGGGSMNMVDFFLDNSHGTLDLSGSQVFGWYTLTHNRSDYAGNVASPPPGQFNRNGLFDLCRHAATADGVDLSRFAGVVVSMAGSVDLFGYVGGMAAFCDSLSLQPSLLGQEMGHGYGLDHARRDGSEDDYQDPYDVMSTANAYEAANPEWERVGPGLCAPSMRARGWLDESRVWHATSEPFDETIELRPLHRRDLGGSLAAEVGPYLVEFRMKERWDAAIPRSCVLVHRFADNHSYLMPAVGGSLDLGSGDAFQSGSDSFPYSEYSRVEVDSIDEAARTARVRIAHHAARPFPRYEVGGRVLGGIPFDGDGIIIVGGHVIRVPPRGPEYAILEQLAASLAVGAVTDIGARSGLRRAAIAAIARSALVQLDQLEPLRGMEDQKELAEPIGQLAADRGNGGHERDSQQPGHTEGVETELLQALKGIEQRLDKLERSTAS